MSRIEGGYSGNISSERVHHKLANNSAVQHLEEPHDAGNKLNMSVWFSSQTHICEFSNITKTKTKSIIFFEIYIFPTHTKETMYVCFMSHQNVLKLINPLF